MEIKVQQKFLLMSPRKIRPVADMVRKLTPEKSVEVLPFVGKRAAEPLLKVIKSALAIAKERGITDGLVFKEIQIGEGPRLKRGQPVSRGQWHPIKKRMSHIRVVLTTINKQQPTEKKAEKGKKKNGTKN